MKEKVFISGGAGYLGSRLARYFLKNNFEVIIGARAESSFKNRSDLQGINCRKLDLTSQTIDDFDFAGTHLIHLASPNAADCKTDPARAKKTVVDGTSWLVNTASNAASITYFSTAHVYGEMTGVLSELSPTKPKSVYAEVHLKAEEICSSSKVNSVRIFRLSNSVGAPTHAKINAWSLLANDLCRQAIETQKLKMNSHGLDWRNFIPIEDVERAVLFGIQDELKGTYNLGSRSSMRLIELAELIQNEATRFLNKEIRLETPAGDPSKSPGKLEYKVDLLKSAGFTPNTPMETSIRSTLIACKNFFTN